MQNEQAISDAADNFSQQLTEDMFSLVDGPVKELLGVFPVIANNSEYTEENKVTLYRHLQKSLVAPFIGGAVNSAIASGMPLHDFLSLVGRAWDQIRAEHLGNSLANFQNNVNNQENQ